MGKRRRNKKRPSVKAEETPEAIIKREDNAHSGLPTLPIRHGTIAETSHVSDAPPDSDSGILQQDSQRVQCAKKVLCHLCQSLFEMIRHENREIHPHCQDTSTLLRSIQSGCYICGLIWVKLAVVRASADVQSESALPGYGLYCEASKLRDHRTISFGYRTTANKGYNTSIEGKLFLFFNVLRANQFEHTATTDLLSNSTAHGTSLELARRWLQDCLQCSRDHSFCKPKIEISRRLPKRLVFCGKTASDESPRLCEGDDIPSNVSYLTLSHCWGGVDIYSLKCENRQSFKIALPLKRLSKTFSDAIAVTRQLGYAYVWIDSLCIIQDSEKDWLEESSKMGDIYANAVLNIAATGFPNGKRGIFASRDPSLLLPFNREPMWVEGCYLCDMFWNDEVEDAPLNRRCWVTQERLLSPRTLHFGSRQLFWECISVTACEAFPAGFPTATSWYYSLKRVVSRLVTQANEKEKHETWERIVEYYTRGSLTRHSDKLIAISGIAAKMRMLQDEYLAGLWKRALPRQLLWYVKQRPQATRLSFNYKTPTWSWASLNAEISFLGARYLDEDLQTQLVEASIVPLDSNDFGSVAAGYIRIKGPLRRAQGLALDSWTTHSGDWYLEYSGFLFRPDLVRDEFLELRHCTLRQVWPREFEVDRGYGIVSYSDLYLIPISVDCLKQDLGGLVLAPTRRAKGEFYRLGWFKARHGMKDELNGPAKGIGDEDYEISHGSSNYTIKLV